MSEFSDRMKLLLNSFGSADISSKTGISKTQLYRLCESGKDTTRANLIKLSEATGVNLFWLATGDGEMFSLDTPLTPAMESVLKLQDMMLPKGAVKQLELHQAAMKTLGVTEDGAGYKHSQDEEELLSLYRKAPLVKKMKTVQMLSENGSDNATGGNAGISVTGDGNETAGRDLNK